VEIEAVVEIGLKMETILLDPGHGSTAYHPNGHWKRPLMTTGVGGVIQVCGTSRHAGDWQKGFYREDIGTLQICNAAVSHLKEAGHEVVVTRNDELDVATYHKNYMRMSVLQKIWAKRPGLKYGGGAATWIRRYAELMGTTMGVHVHTNAGGGTGVKGYYFTEEGKLLSASICATVADYFGLRNRGSDKHGYAMIKKHSQDRNCLIECCFHDHENDLEILLKDDGITSMGRCLAEGILGYLG